MDYDFDRIIDRRNTNSGKWEWYGEDILPMWVADMDFESPEEVKESIIERVQHGVFGYPGMVSEFREVICERMSRLYGWKVEPDEIIFLPGLVSGLKFAADIVGERSSTRVIAQTPVYGPFLMIPDVVGREVVHSPMAEVREGQLLRYEIDFDALKKDMTPDVKLFQICNPQNPVGRVNTRSELERIAELCLQRDVVMVSDEIHCDLILDGHTHIPTATLSQEVAQQTITLMAPSKTFNLAGLFCGYAIVQNKELRDKMYKAALGAGVSVLSFYAGMAAYQHGQEWLDQLLRYLAANRDFTVAYIQEHLPQIVTTSPDSTYLIWLDCREAGMEGNPADFLREKAKVAVNDGAWFGEGGEGFVRLNFGTQRSRLAEGLDRIHAALVKGN